MPQNILHTFFFFFFFFLNKQGEKSSATSFCLVLLSHYKSRTLCGRAAAARANKSPPSGA